MLRQSNKIIKVWWSMLITEHWSFKHHDLHNVFILLMEVVLQLWMNPYLIWVPCVHHLLGPWSPACLEPGDDVPEKGASVCRWSFSCRPAHTRAPTKACALEKKPFYRWVVPCCLHCEPLGCDPAPDREGAQGEEVGLCQENQRPIEWMHMLHTKLIIVNLKRNILYVFYIFLLQE